MIVLPKSAVAGWNLAAQLILGLGFRRPQNLAVGGLDSPFIYRHDGHTPGTVKQPFQLLHRFPAWFTLPDVLLDLLSFVAGHFVQHELNKLLVGHIMRTHASPSFGTEILVQVAGQPQHGTMQMDTHRLLGTTHDFPDLGRFQPFQTRQDERIGLASRQPGESRGQLLL